MNAISQLRRHALLQGWRSEAQIDKTRSGVSAFKKRPSHDKLSIRAGAQPSWPGKSESPDGSQRFPSGACSLSNGLRIAAAPQLTKSNAFNKAQQEKRWEVFVRKTEGFSMQRLGNGNCAADKPEQIQLFQA